LAVGKGALNHPSSGVRRAAIKVLPKNNETAETFLSLDLLTDKDPLVALNAALALSESPFSTKVQQALISALESPQYLSDKWIPEAYTILAASNKSQFLKAYLSKSKGIVKPKSTVKKTSAAMPASSHHHHATGDLVSFTATIKNQGTTATVPGKTIGLLFTVGGERFWNDVFKDPIQPGESITLSQSNGRNGKYWKAVQGSFVFKASVNERHQNEDSNPGNNEREDSIKVRPITSMMPLVVTNVSRSYTIDAPYDSVIRLLNSLKNISDEDAEPILSGVFQGWPAKQSVAKEKDRKVIQSLLASADEMNGLLLDQLSGIWTKPEEKDDKDVVKIFISSVPEMIKFSKKEFVVEAGKRVEIIFDNPDQMQHNIVIGA
ncbi:hypothetical protein HMI54_011674, partial [Coelomomyces lativittatus]